MKLSFPARRSSDLLVRSSGIESVRIPIADHTRVSHTVHERSSGLEFRFVPEGPAVAPGEWRACLTALEAVNCDYLLASGSLPRGVPADFRSEEHTSELQSLMRISFADFCLK